MFAPVPFNVTDVPLHITVLLAVEPTVGKGFTVIVLTAVFVQPFTAVPVTVYVAVVVGEKATPFNTPPDHVYVLAPVPFNVTEAPLHITELLVVDDTVGGVFTVIVLTAVFVQPVAALVPVTVYVVVIVGVNATPSVTPPVQVNVLAPVPFKVTELPLQITEPDVVDETVGFGFTVTV